MTKKVLAVIVGMSVILTAGYALAGSANGTALYQVQLVDGCTIDTSATGTDFGTFPVGSADLADAAAGTVAINCGPTVNYTWGVDSGLNPTLAEELTMVDGANSVTYVLKEGGSPIGDNGMNAIDAGATSANSIAPRTGTGTGVVQNMTLTADVYISAGVVGNYTDTVTVTVVW